MEIEKYRNIKNIENEIVEKYRIQKYRFPKDLEHRNLNYRTFADNP